MRSSKWISLVLLLATVSVGRADDSWRDGEYSKTVVRGEAVPIKKLLSDFGQAQRVPVIIDEEISGDVVTQ